MRQEDLEKATENKRILLHQTCSLTMRVHIYRINLPAPILGVRAESVGKRARGKMRYFSALLISRHESKPVFFFALSQPTSKTSTLRLNACWAAVEGGRRVRRLQEQPFPDTGAHERARARKAAI